MLTQFEGIMMRSMLWAQAIKAWDKVPNRMVALAPGEGVLHPEYRSCFNDRWLLADKHAIVGTGFSVDDIRSLRDEAKRRRG